ncbi:glycerate kinase [Aurantiacibacter xanthus]|uniref:Glycerate kinase n=1 Tax=Aurantiacibacter xanthus TaxID=1784712 RepID=A0A3A1P0X2_9SPHN|nr:glycerate kinase [Aurantiacibacter xanthus]RIV80146.1 glycerate kinase [Aurantiacibacter xanthus]
MCDATGVRQLLSRLFEAGVAAARPEVLIASLLPSKPSGRCLVIGAGKASAAMAKAVEQSWPDVELSGVVSTRYGHGVACDRIMVIEAGHPVPDASSVVAAEAMLGLLAGSRADDLVLALISGGGSACLAKPRAGLTLDAKRAITDALLKSGATIAEMNCIRAHLSAVKGGQLALAAYPARLVTLVISDIPGDDPALVASGPTLPCASTPADALALLDRYGIALPLEVRSAFEQEASTAASDLADMAADCRIVASPQMALSAIAKLAVSAGFEVEILGDSVEGEASMVAQQIAELCIERAADSSRTLPLAIISGGETTVTLPSGCNANGGRNTEFQLALALALDGHPRIWSIAGDSDGIDGVSDAAGAIVEPDTLLRARTKSMTPASLLKQHRSYDFFAGLGDLVKTGPTLTNVNDLRIQLIF